MLWDSPSVGSIALLCGREMECPCYTAVQPQISMAIVVQRCYGKAPRMVASRCFVVARWSARVTPQCNHRYQWIRVWDDLGYKNRSQMFPLSSVWYSFKLTHSSSPLSIIALIVIFYSTCFTHNSQLFLFSLLVPSYPSLVCQSLLVRVLVALDLGR